MLGLGIACKQEDLVVICKPAKMTSIPEEDIEHLVGQLGVKTHSSERLYLLLIGRIDAVLIIKIVEASIFQFSNVPESMESLNVPEFNDVMPK